MVPLSVIRKSNFEFGNSPSSQNTRLTVVFAGATSGTGYGTIMRLATMLHAPTFYVLGRSEIKFSSQREKLHALNPGIKLVFVEVELTLLRDTDKACEKITKLVRTNRGGEKIDLLYMSCGCMPLNGAEYTKENLDVSFVLSYYTRALLTNNLLPLIRASPHPVIISVLNGGREVPMDTSDIGFSQPGAWAVRKMMAQTTNLMSLSFSHLSSLPENSSMAFIHVFPGLVSSDNFSRLRAPPESTWWWKVGLWLIQSVVGVLHALVGSSLEDAGERMAWLMVGKGLRSGAWRVDDKSEIVAEDKEGIFESYRDEGWGTKVWDYTVRIWDRGLTETEQ